MGVENVSDAMQSAKNSLTESENDNRNALQKKHEAHVQNAQERHAGQEPKTFEASPPTPITQRVTNMISEKMGSSDKNETEGFVDAPKENDSSMVEETKSAMNNATENARETVQEISEEAQKAAEEARQRVMESREEVVEVVTTINDLGTPAYGVSTEDGHTTSEVAELRALETAAMIE